MANIEPQFILGTCSLPPKSIELLQKYFSVQENIREGLLNSGRKIVKSLLKASTANGITLPVEDDHPGIEQLCTFIHHMLLHGIRGNFFLI
mgnify:CR=1 FL=1